MGLVSCLVVPWALASGLRPRTYGCRSYKSHMDKGYEYNSARLSAYTSLLWKALDYGIYARG